MKYLTVKDPPLVLTRICADSIQANIFIDGKPSFNLTVFPLHMVIVHLHYSCFSIATHKDTEISVGDMAGPGHQQSVMPQSQVGEAIRPTTTYSYADSVKGKERCHI